MTNFKFFRNWFAPSFCRLKKVNETLNDPRESNNAGQDLLAMEQGKGRGMVRLIRGVATTCRY